MAIPEHPDIIVSEDGLVVGPDTVLPDLGKDTSQELFPEDYKLDPWRVVAACRGQDTRLFFPVSNESPEDKIKRQEQARRICGSCAVRRECLEYALGKREPWGIWGGEELSDGKIVKGKQIRDSSAA